MENSTPPFACKHSSNLPELLTELNCSIALSTYQAGKVIFISAKNKEELVQLPRTFDKAMGMTLRGNKMALATREEVIVLADHPELGKHYPKNSGVYDHFFVPRATYHSGQVDIHDLEWGNEGLWAVNTSFSCLCLIDENFSFVPKWKPSFITELVSEDRCHLNGMALKDGKPKYVTTLGHKNSFQSWRENITQGGLLIDVEKNEIILENLPLPHSPQFYLDKLYLLFSATGEIVCYDENSGKYELIKKLNGFVRGMAVYKDYMFVGMSKLRQNSSTFKQLPIAELSSDAGIIVIHIPTKSTVASLYYKSSVDEIYDIMILPGMNRPGILNTIDPVFRMGLSIPGADYWAKIDKPVK